MTKKLYIGNLPYSTTETVLRELFAQAGEVTDVAIITDRDTGRSRGFAFVEMATDDAARQAIHQLDGKTLDDRTITVAEARPQAPRYSTESNRSGYGSSHGGYGGSRGGYGGGRRRR